MENLRSVKIAVGRYLMSELAQQRIAECKRTKNKFLDLGNCGLTEVPSDIGELGWLESLSLASEWFEWEGRGWRNVRSQNGGGRNALVNIDPVRTLKNLRSFMVDQIADISPLAGLRNLEQLLARVSGVRDLRPLSLLAKLRVLNVAGSDVGDLAPLSQLAALEALHLSGTYVADLEPLARLSALQALYVAQTDVADLAPLSGLSSLRILRCWSTKINDLSPLSALNRLEELHAGQTKVSDLEPLRNLSRLEMVDVAQTQVTDLSPVLDLIRRGCSVEWKASNWSDRAGIFVGDCPLVYPPPGVAKQGRQAILNYVGERTGGVDHLYEAKMLILGEGRSGKTSLLRRLYKPSEPLPSESDTTKGIEIFPHIFKLKNGQEFRLNVWDFGGQQIYRATHQFFLTQRSLYVLVDDTSKDHTSVTDEGFKYWLDLIEIFGGHSPVLIFQNEKGGRSKAIDIEGIRRQFDNVKEVYRGDLKHKNAADLLRDEIEHQAAKLRDIQEELPVGWIGVRADVERRASQEAYISSQEFLKICKKRHSESNREEFDPAKALYLSRYLHEIGVLLHFQDDALLSRTVILQNRWATDAVFRILDDETVKAKRGRFNEEDCRRLWRDSAYADMHLELRTMMERFELCYKLRESNPPEWLAPQLLSPTRPKEMSNWGKPEDMVLRYRYGFLPKGMISRLTVRQHRFVRNPDLAWEKGVLFDLNTTAVLAQVLEDNPREIELRARGPQKKELLSAIAFDLDALNDSFPGLRNKWQKLIPCNCEVCQKQAVAHFFEERELLRYREHGVASIRCSESLKEVDVVQLLDGAKLERQPAAEPSVGRVGSPRTIQIFLASSSELEKERDAFDLYFRQRNDEHIKLGFYLKIVRWEKFLDAMSDTRLQDEYNEAIRHCDVFVSLFFTKAGKFTGEEFNVAFEHFQAKHKPLIYTFFKNAAVNTGELSKQKKDLMSLWAFQEKLSELGHYQTNYNSIEDLKLKFRDQLDMILEKLAITQDTAGAGQD